MTKKVPYLYEEQIERDAAVLLAEYSHARGVTIEPPIPIEDIVEKHLKLGIEFDDTHKLFGTHAWLHSACWSAWHQVRRADAIAALNAMGIRA